MSHECHWEMEGDHHVMYGCDAPVAGKWRGHWYCSEHLDDQMKLANAVTPTDIPDSKTFL